MSGLLWSILAWLCARPAVATWIIRRAQRTPYWHLEGYMERWWLFNGWDDENDGEESKRFQWLPSARVHHILRADHERDDHNHPWPARTIVLRHWYKEKRPIQVSVYTGKPEPIKFKMDIEHHRGAGSTARIAANDFHRITEVHPEGVWTLFITWRKVQTWGFMTKDGFVPHKRYFAAQRRKGKGIV